jgi:hypothetical protein
MLWLYEHLAAGKSREGRGPLQRGRVENATQSMRGVFDVRDADQRRFVTLPDGHRSPAGRSLGA